MLPQRSSKNLWVVSSRSFGKPGKTRPLKVKRRHALKYKQKMPRKPWKEPPDVSPTRTLTATPWGPPRYPVPRVEETSTEFHQNVHSLCRLVGHSLQCSGLTVASVSHSSKAAMERLEHYSPVIRREVAYIHLYQFVIVPDILGYSRDMGSRNTLWIPDDFTAKELIAYLKEECIADPKLAPMRRLDMFLNPFQPTNWAQVDRLHHLDGSSVGKSRPYPIPQNEYHKVEPVELVRIREKGRNAIVDGDEYVDASDYFRYWSVPLPDTDSNAQGIDKKVPPYKVPMESTQSAQCDDHCTQIDEVESLLDAELEARSDAIVAEVEAADSRGLTSIDFDEKNIRFNKAENYVELDDS